MSGTGPGGNEPLPGRRLLPLIAQRSTLQRQTETGADSAKQTQHHIFSLQTLAHLLSRDKNTSNITSTAFQRNLLCTAGKRVQPFPKSCQYFVCVYFLKGSSTKKFSIA